RSPLERARRCCVPDDIFPAEHDRPHQRQLAVSSQDQNDVDRRREEDARLERSGGRREDQDLRQGRPDEQWAGPVRLAGELPLWRHVGSPSRADRGAQGRAQLFPRLYREEPDSFERRRGGFTGREHAGSRRSVAEREGTGHRTMNEYVCIASDVKLGRGVKLSKFINLYGCEVGDDTKIGAFVEIQKNAKVGKNCKISSHRFICEGREMSANSKVPFVDLVTPHRELEEELVSVFRNALRTAGFVGGSVVEDFEREYAEFSDVKYCVGVASGTDALRFALIAAGVQPGDTVVTVPNTFIATTEAITQVGARPDFVDVEARTYTMDPEKLRLYLETQCTRDVQTGRVVSKRTGGPVSAVIPVHLYGQIADMDPIVELAAQYGLT